MLHSERTASEIDCRHCHKYTQNSTLRTPDYVCLHEYGDGKSNSKMGSHALVLSHDIYISPGSSGWPVPENHGVTAYLCIPTEIQQWNV